MKNLPAVVLWAAVAAMLLLGVCSESAPAQATQPAPARQPADPAPQIGTLDVDALRDQLKAAYQRGDVEGMLQYLHPQVVITFPDGEVLEGPGALVEYYQRMLHGPERIVQSYTSNPIVSHRYLHGDTVVSHGLMNDHYVLTNGMQFGLDSRFTVTAIRIPDGPTQTNGWVIRSFHSSTDAFENAVLAMAVRRSLWSGGIVGLIVGLVLGTAVTWLLRRRPAPAPAA